MKQLELDFNSIDLSDHYKAYRVIDEGKNQICSYDKLILLKRCLRAQYIYKCENFGAL